jgi:hypothetical protein
MKTSNHPDPKAREMFNKLYAEQAAIEAERPAIQAEGEAALRRLFDIAQSDTGQCKIIAKFLLGCYNGDRFPFDLTDFRSLDHNLFMDCLAVLKMDAQPKQEVHNYFPDGGRKFEKMVEDWNIADHWAMEIELDGFRKRSGEPPIFAHIRETLG